MYNNVIFIRSKWKWKENQEGSNYGQCLRINEKKRQSTGEQISSEFLEMKNMYFFRKKLTIVLQGFLDISQLRKRAMD